MKYYGFKSVAKFPRSNSKRFGFASSGMAQVISQLFANNEQGFAFDFNDLSTMFQDSAGTIAKYYGTGDNALSVKLVDKDSNIFWGCHSWWQPQDYGYFTKAPPPETIPNASDALAALYERVVDGGVPFDNWTAALDELGLSVWQEPQEL